MLAIFWPCYYYISIENLKIKGVNKKMEKVKKQGNQIFFTITMVSLILQTVLTFVLLLNMESTPLIRKIVGILFGVFVVSFLILTLMSKSQKKYSRQALGAYKTAMKGVKYILKLTILAMSILNIVGASKINVFALITSVFSLVLVILSIAIDFFVATVKHKISRKKKKWQQAREQKKQEAELRKIEEENLNSTTPGTLIGKTINGLFANVFFKNTDKKQHEDIVYNENSTDVMVENCMDTKTEETWYSEEKLNEFKQKPKKQAKRKFFGDFSDKI